MINIRHTTSGGGFSGALDIGIGASGSEVVVASNLMETANDSGYNVSNYCFPLSIKAGTRISARAQTSTSSSNTLFFQVILFDGAFTEIEGYAGVDALGFNSATTLGTAVATSSGAKGAYVQMAASTARDYAGIMMAMDIQGGSGFYIADIDIAIGASGSEMIIIPDFYIWVNGGGSLTMPYAPVPIPKGTRIAARALEANSGATIGITLYGVYQ
jgi:hypothetical protein